MSQEFFFISFFKLKNYISFLIYSFDSAKIHFRKTQQSQRRRLETASRFDTIRYKSSCVNFAYRYISSQV